MNRILSVTVSEEFSPNGNDEDSHKDLIQSITSVSGIGFWSTFSNMLAGFFSELIYSSIEFSVGSHKKHLCWLWLNGVRVSLSK